MISFQVGQKVVCVNNEEMDLSIITDKPPVCTEIEVGQIYTVRWIGTYHDDEFGVFVGIRLVEVDRTDEYWFGDEEMPFDATRFRPLVQTDISVFQQMLNTVPTEVLEDA